MEDVPKPWGATARADRDGDRFGLQGPPVSLKGPFSIKRVHGIVPVEEDGSALFTVPANLNVYFQVLDGEYLELQRMRTFVNLAPGERRSCIGCHEPRVRAPAVRRARALDAPPLALRPQPGERGPRAVHYPADVQLAWDRHCVGCHGDADPKGGLSLSGTMTVFFSRSYEELINKKWISNIDIEPRDARIPAEPPLSVGSHRSRLVQVLRSGHYDAKLDPEEFVRLVTWIDANAPFYGTYEGRRNVKWKGQPGFRPDPVAVRR